ncbi:MAG: UDP-N-acetylglucosamine 2-epimerase (non-hydrolyzing) [Oricola sp.]
MTASVLSIVGARPQFVKAGAVSRALGEAGIDEVLVHTGQHFDAAMSQVFFDDLGIPEPRYNLAIHSLGHGAMTGRMLEGLEEVMIAERPRMVLVYGDTNSTLAGALASAKLHIPVAHVEAGLRSFNRRMPEEINRVAADHVSEILFCPTRTAVANLANESVTRNVHMVGDVMYDATIYALRRAEERSSIIEQLGLGETPYGVATIHRAENTDDPARFGRIVDWLVARSLEQPIVIPVHPRTKRLLEEKAVAGERLRLIEPLGYLDMARLLSRAKAVYTDSGGLQKEAYFHRVACVTLRDETEWVETIEAGWNRLWTTEEYRARAEITDYGAGDAAQKIANIVKGWLEAA